MEHSKTTTSEKETKEEKKIKKPNEEVDTRTNENTKEEKPQKKHMNAWLALLIKIGVIIVIIFICSFFIQVTFLHTNEMFPSLRDGDLILSTNLLSYSFNDVILYEVERNGEKEKHFGRIMCLGNNDVEIDSAGNIKVNDSILGVNNYYEEYEHGDLEYPYHVDENSVFVIQDYRPEVSDSRVFGAIPRENIIGKIFFTFRIRGF